MTKVMYNTVINIYVMRYLKLEPDRSFWISKVINRVLAVFAAFTIIFGCMVTTS